MQAAPFVKWCGGKRQLLPQLLPLFPPPGTYHRYLEPFLGGGAVFFALANDLKTYRVKVMLNDFNEELMRTYKTIQDGCGLVLANLDYHQELHRKNAKEHFYAVRGLDRQPGAMAALSSSERAARFIYLNKTCFNGLVRSNKRGELNAPLGAYKHESLVLFNAANLLAVEAALTGVGLFCGDFETDLDDAGEGDFVYIDSPYVPISDTANFTSYTAEGFSERDHRRLAAAFSRASGRGARLALSNSDTPLVRELYKHHRIEQVQATRAINSKGSRRGKIPEVVVMNYIDRTK